MSESETVPPATPDDVRPKVGRATSNRGAWLFGGLLLLSGLGLFAALEARRSELVSPAITAPTDFSGAAIAAPPMLAIPEAAVAEMTYSAAAPSLLPATNQPIGPAVQTAGLPPRYPLVQQAPAGAYPPPLPAPITAPQAAPSPAFAFQAPQRAAAGPTSPKPGEERRSDERAVASKLLNPSTTVPLGTVIQAVMETAFDSTRSGFARAVVSRDVSSFDGSRVLIPRGSKLFGEYKADVGYGQKRASIQWHRLTRPDGSIIDVDSPAADPLGRIGVKGRVNNHFFARFGGAILQTALDIGVQIATRQATGDTVIIGGYPYGGYGGEAAGNLRNALPRVEDIKPTVALKQGAGVTVFVGRDLDFTAVEQ